MRIGFNKGFCGVGALGLLILATACQTSSRKSVRTYDYRDDGRPPGAAERTQQDADDGEYHMVSPGEMVVDPGR